MPLKKKKKAIIGIGPRRKREREIGADLRTEEIMDENLLNDSKRSAISKEDEYKESQRKHI